MGIGRGIVFLLGTPVKLETNSEFDL